MYKLEMFLAGIIEFGIRGASRSFFYPRNCLAFPFQPPSQIQGQGVDPEGKYPCKVWDGAGRTKLIPKGPGNNSWDLLPLWESHPGLSIIFYGSLMAPLMLRWFYWDLWHSQASLGRSSWDFWSGITSQTPGSSEGSQIPGKEQLGSTILKSKDLEVLRDPKSKSLGRSIQGFVILDQIPKTWKF